MKKVFFLFALMGSLLFARPAQAQFSFGVKGGLNIAKISYSGDLSGNFSSDNRAGFFIGPMAEITIPIVGLGVETAALYDQKQLKMGDEKEVMHYLDIPINLKYSIGLGKLASVFAAVGPQFAFNLGNSKNIKEKFDINKSALSLNLGLGAKLLGHLQVGYNYNIALGKNGDFSVLNSVKNAYESCKMKTNSHQISAAYIF